MGAGYHVVLDDLQDMARTMSTESSAFADLRARMAPGPADGGDATLNAGISAVLTMFASLNASVSDAMAEHGKKIQETHDDYRETDSDVVGLYNRLIEEA